MKFSIVILDSNEVEVDNFVIDCDMFSRALLEAERLFCSKHSNLQHLDSGMFVGSNTRDLTVFNKDNSQEEYYQLKIIN